MMSRIGVLCVDDNEAVVSAIRCLVEAENDLHWLGHLESADQLIDSARSLRPTVILLDLDMPGVHPFDAMSQLAREAPDVRVVVVSGYLSDEYIDAAMDAGAWGYVAKSEGPDAIVEAIRRAAQGQVAFSPEVYRQYLGQQ